MCTWAGIVARWHRIIHEAVSTAVPQEKSFSFQKATKLIAAPLLLQTAAKMSLSLSYQITMPNSLSVNAFWGFERVVSKTKPQICHMARLSGSAWDKAASVNAGV
jgi:hypothetical protein